MPAQFCGTTLRSRTIDVFPVASRTSIGGGFPVLAHVSTCRAGGGLVTARRLPPPRCLAQDWEPPSQSLRSLLVEGRTLTTAGLLIFAVSLLLDPVIWSGVAEAFAERQDKKTRDRRIWECTER
jgi:hypothetical protein